MTPNITRLPICKTPNITRQNFPYDVKYVVCLRHFVSIMIFSSIRDVSSVSAFNNKGCVLYKEGQFGQAYQFFSQACKNDATCIEALFNMGKYVPPYGIIISLVKLVKIHELQVTYDKYLNFRKQKTEIITTTNFPAFLK